MKSITHEVKYLRMKSIKGVIGRAILVGCAATTLLALPVSAEVISSKPEGSAKQTLERGLSAMVGAPIIIDSIEPTPASELIEVNIAGDTFFATADGKFLLLNGDLLSISETGAVNLSEEKRVVKRLGLISDLDTSEMIVFAPAGPVKDYINVFTDITCGYCRKLHLEMDDLNRRGIEVRYLAYPRGGPDSQGASQLATAWCSKNRQAALTRMKAGVELPINNCADNPIAKHFALGNKLGVRGTPAIVTSSGMMIPGYRPAADLAQMIGVE